MRPRLKHNAAQLILSNMCVVFAALDAAAAEPPQVIAAKPIAVAQPIAVPRPITAPQSIATPQRGIEPQRLSDEERTAGFKLLFDGRKLDGWETEYGHTTDDWLVDDGAIYCTGARSMLKFTAERLPRDFELRFRWRGCPAGLGHSLFLPENDGGVQFFEKHEYISDLPPGRREGGWGKAGGITYNAASGSLTVTTIADKFLEPQPETRFYEMIGGQADSHLLRRSGEWNEGAIRCVGSKIECRCNGGTAFEYDVARPKDQIGDDSQIALDWVEAKQAGFTLKIECANRPMWVRDIRLCDLTKSVAKPH